LSLGAFFLLFLLGQIPNWSKAYFKSRFEKKKKKEEEGKPRNIMGVKRSCYLAMK